MAAWFWEYQLAARPVPRPWRRAAGARAQLGGGIVRSAQVGRGPAQLTPACTQPSPPAAGSGHRCLLPWEMVASALAPRPGRLFWSGPGSAHSPHSPRRPLLGGASPGLRSCSLTRVGRRPDPAPRYSPGTSGRSGLLGRVGWRVWGRRPRDRLLLGRPTHLNVRAYLLPTRVCHVVSGSFPTQEVHLFLFFLRK